MGGVLASRGQQCRTRQSKYVIAVASPTMFHRLAGRLERRPLT